MDISQVQSKDEALNLMNGLIDKFGITKKEGNEVYNSSKIGGGNSKPNLTRIRLLSENESILKLMVPWGNRANGPTYHAYPLLISANKYAIGHNATPINAQKTNAPISYNPHRSNFFNTVSENQITKLNNYYAYAAGGTNQCGFLAQNKNWTGFNNDDGNPTNGGKDGLGTLFQDNYEDKPEIRCRTYSCNFNKNGITGISDYYSKNGHCCATGFNYYDSRQNVNYGNSVTVVITYKTSTTQYQGMFPVFSPSEQKAN